MSNSRNDAPVDKTVIFEKKKPSVQAIIQNSLEDLDLFGMMDTEEIEKEEPTPLKFAPQRIAENTGLEDLFSGFNVSSSPAVVYSIRSVMDYHIYGKLTVARRILVLVGAIKCLALAAFYACSELLLIDAIPPLLLVFWSLLIPPRVSVISYLLHCISTLSS
jgi:hypothetical protein